VLNLATNAWHAMTGESGLIEIAVDWAANQTEAPPGQVRLTVRDNGRGMNEATRQRIFEPFFTTKGQGVGTGLGLSVVHGIVQQMNGTISVTSSPGAGTTFELLFPEATGDVAAAAPVSPQLLRGNGEGVLYIDDEEPLVYLAVRMLTSLGYRASGFVRAEDGLAALRADPSAFDVVVTDYNMPGLSGLQVAKEVAQLRPDLPVLLTSGYINDELCKKAAELGVRHVVEKPDTIDGLCAKVHEVVRQKR
jgi:CheY-like chemotaxis protein